LGPGHEGNELKVSRAYIAGLGTTGVLIGSFLLLLTVGSALVAFQGVPGQATNGDLSSIELQQQAERAGGAVDGNLLATVGVLGATETGFVDGASGDVFGVRASGSLAAGRIFGSNGLGQGDALRPGAPSVGERLPTGGGQSSTPGSSLSATPPAAGADTPATGGDTGTGSGTTDPGTGTGTTDPGTGTGTTDPGTGTTDPGTGTGGATGVGDTVTDTVDNVIGSVSGGPGQSGTSGSGSGGLLDDVTSVVGGLTG